MVRDWFLLLRLIGVFCLSLGAHTVFAASININSNQVQLGEAVQLKIHLLPGESLDGELQQLPWQRWQQHFAIELHSHGSSSAIYYLYPYQVGQFTLDKGGRFRGEQVLVTPNPMVDLTWQKWAEPYVYQRQSWAWRAKVNLADSNLRVELAAFSGSEWQSNPQGLTVAFGKQKLLSGDLSGELDAWYQWQEPTPSSVQDSFGELSAPFAAQDQSLTLIPSEREKIFVSPALLVYPAGTARPWKFFDRPLPLTIKSLPSFLPPQVLLGALHLQPQSLPSWGQQGDIVYWHWLVDGAQMSQKDFKQAMSQLLAEQPKNAEFEWFAPSIEFKSGHLAEIRIPLRLQTSGEVSLPIWQWRYFDLQSGKLKVQSADQQQIWVLTTWHLNMIFVLFGLLAATLLLGVVIALRFYWLRRQLLRWLAIQPKAVVLSNQLWRRSADWLMQPVALNWQTWAKQMQVSDQVLSQLQQAAYSKQADCQWREPVISRLKARHLNWSVAKAYLVTGGRLLRAAVNQASKCVLDKLRTSAD